VVLYLFFTTPPLNTFCPLFQDPVYKKKKLVKTNVFFGKFTDQIFNVAQRVPWKFTDTPRGGAAPPG